MEGPTNPYRLPADTAFLLGLDRLSEPWAISLAAAEKMLTQLGQPADAARAMLRAPQAALEFLYHLQTAVVIGALRAMQRALFPQPFHLPTQGNNQAVRLHEARLELARKRSQIARIYRYDLALAMLMALETTDVEGNPLSF